MQNGGPLLILSLLVLPAGAAAAEPYVVDRATTATAPPAGDAVPPWPSRFNATGTVDAPGAESRPPCVEANQTEYAADGARPMKLVWGELDVKVFPDAGRVAPNGKSYNPIFSLDVGVNVWLWRSQGVYLYASSRFWGGRGGEAGQTQGNIDYTRREFDMTSGVAWNYYGPLEVRFVGYDRENFNRGVSLVAPGGTTNDGAGVEQRLYLNEEYTRLGQDGFNESRASFVSLGYFPTKSIIGGDGFQYRPGLFAHAYLTWDIPETCAYLFVDLQQIFQRSSFLPRMLYSDVGLAFTPFETVRGLEFRLGSEFNTDFNASGSVRNMSLPYVSVRLNY